MDEEIKKLFKKRDDAVKHHDASSFTSTQVDNYTSASDSFLSLVDMKTDILFVYTEKETPFRTVVFVKENYTPKDIAPYSYLATYHLANTTQGWKIYRLVYSY